MSAQPKLPAEQSHGPKAGQQAIQRLLLLALHSEALWLFHAGQALGSPFYVELRCLEGGNSCRTEIN